MLTDTVHVKINSFKINVLHIVMLLLLFIITPAIALTSDQAATLEFNSDSASCHRNNNETECIYEGHVVLKQDVNVLEAPKVTVYKKYDKIYKIEAIGKRAHYQTVSEENRKKIDAVANIITLYPDKNLMVLIGDGEIKEDQNKFTGPYIEYVFKKARKQ